MTAPTHLRVEHLDDPLGLTVQRPRLSWRLPAGTSVQTAYRLRAGSWDSGRITSARSVLVPYEGPPLSSGERVDWSVKVWTDTGESDWAEAAWWETGLLEPADWIARWIAPPASDATDPAAAHPVWHLRGIVRTDRRTRQARLYATAHGVYEFFINGHRVGDDELTPGFTSYHTTQQVQTYDVTALLRPGPNVLGAIVSGGWIKWTRRYRRLPLSLLAQLHVVDDRGLLTRSGTGPEWAATIGAIRTADLRQGQVVDLRRDVPHWSELACDDAGWLPVDVLNAEAGALVGSPAPPVRRVQELDPVAVTRPLPGRQVFDLGQNINGWLRLSDLGPPGTTLTLIHGEALDADGDVVVDHITDPETDPETPFQTDQVTAGPPGGVFEPRHTTHGFRYVRIEGHPRELSTADLKGVVVHTDMRRTGWFECSDERINKLHEAAVWSFRDNACDIPTDCPTRERAGWTGDWQIFVSTAAFLYDVAGFSTKWLCDLAADQSPSGVVPHCVPNPEFAEFYEKFPPGAAGWGDAAVIVPWEIYRAYGDRDLLDRQWNSMTGWVDYAARISRERRHPSRIAARPKPTSHEEYLWDTGFHWGEWLEPDSMPGQNGDREAVDAMLAGLRTADHGNLATAYLHHSARILTRAAAVLDRVDAMVRYRHLALSTRRAWRREFLTADGTVLPESQAGYVRALAFNLLPDERRAGAARRLAELIKAADTHLTTGFLTTPYLLPALADNGQVDLAYELLFQDTEPSWLTMIRRGATTVWEHWSGVDENGVASHSLNHYSKGAVISFLHRYIAGIRLLDHSPAYRRFRIEPVPGGGITSCSAAHESPYGRIESSWRIENEEFVLDVRVPPGTMADIRLPDGQAFKARPGVARYTCALKRTPPGGDKQLAATAGSGGGTDD